MRLEAITALPRLGELHVADLRAAFGDEIWAQHYVDVLVLGRPGRSPVAARVLLADVQQGRGRHLALMCEGCALAVFALFTCDTVLRCRRCCGRRTRQQHEKGTAGWLYEGDREDDRLHRLVTHGVKTEAARRLGQGLVHQLLTLDGDRTRRLVALAARALEGEQ